MAYSVDWLNLVVTIPKADLALVSASPEVRELSIVDLWGNLHDIQDSFPAMGYPDIMQGIPPSSFAPRGVLIDPKDAGWLIEFEDGAYTVNLTEGNSDLQENRVQNQVSVSDKTLTGQDPDAIATAVWSRLTEDAASAQDMLREIWSAAAGKGGRISATQYAYRDRSDSKDRIVATTDAQGLRTAVTHDPTD